MGLAFNSFDQENAMLFAKLEEISGKIFQLSKEKTSREQEIVSLKYRIQNAEEENAKLKEEVKFLKRTNSELNAKVKTIDQLSKQNFSIKDKIARLAEDTESQEEKEVRRKDLIEALIAEIDHCISQLQS